jgi:hypothetical protein
MRSTIGIGLPASSIPVGGTIACALASQVTINPANNIAIANKKFIPQFSPIKHATRICEAGSLANSKIGPYCQHIIGPTGRIDSAHSILTSLAPSHDCMVNLQTNIQRFRMFFYGPAGSQINKS